MKNTIIFTLLFFLQITSATAQQPFPMQPPTEEERREFQKAMESMPQPTEEEIQQAMQELEQFFSEMAKKAQEKKEIKKPEKEYDHEDYGSPLMPPKDKQKKRPSKKDKKKKETKKKLTLEELFIQPLEPDSEKDKKKEEPKIPKEKNAAYHIFIKKFKTLVADLAHQIDTNTFGIKYKKDIQQKGLANVDNKIIIELSTIPDDLKYAEYATLDQAYKEAFFSKGLTKTRKKIVGAIKKLENIEKQVHAEIKKKSEKQKKMSEKELLEKMARWEKVPDYKMPKKLRRTITNFIKGTLKPISKDLEKVSKTETVTKALEAAKAKHEKEIKAAQREREKASRYRSYAPSYGSGYDSSRGYRGDPYWHGGYGDDYGKDYSRSYSPTPSRKRRPAKTKKPSKKDVKKDKDGATAKEKDVKKDPFQVITNLTDEIVKLIDDALAMYKGDETLIDIAATKFASKIDAKIKQAYNKKTELNEKKKKEFEDKIEKKLNGAITKFIKQLGVRLAKALYQKKYKNEKESALNILNLEQKGIRSVKNTAVKTYENELLAKLTNENVNTLKGYYEEKGIRALRRTIYALTQDPIADRRKVEEKLAAEFDGETIAARSTESRKTREWLKSKYMLTWLKKKIDDQEENVPIFARNNNNEIQLYAITHLQSLENIGTVILNMWQLPANQLITRALAPDLRRSIPDERARATKTATLVDEAESIPEAWSTRILEHVANAAQIDIQDRVARRADLTADENGMQKLDAIKKEIDKQIKMLTRQINLQKKIEDDVRKFSSQDEE